MSVDVVDLELTVVKADGLAAKDTNIFGMKTKSDPYVEVRLCPQGCLGNPDETKILVGKTVPKMKTLAPRWDKSFKISHPKKDLGQMAVFELTIMDYDRGNDDDLMGVVQVPINRTGTTTKWYGVPATSANGEEATGRVQCTLANFSGVKTHAELQAQAENRSQQANENVDKPTKDLSGDFVELKLTVKKADDLVAMDHFLGMKAKSDPYIEVRLCPQGPQVSSDKKMLLGKTSTQFKTLSPKYNESFSTTLPKKNITDVAVFELTIYDYDDHNDDDLMGVVHVPVLVNFAGTSTKWYEVPKCSGEENSATGRVQCTLQKSAVKENPDSQVDTADRLKAAMAARKKGPAAAAVAPAKPSPSPASIATTVISDESEPSESKEEEEEEEAPRQRISTSSRQMSSRRLNRQRSSRTQSPKRDNPMRGSSRSSVSSSLRRSGTSESSAKEAPPRIKRTSTGESASRGMRQMRRSPTADNHMRPKRSTSTGDGDIRRAATAEGHTRRPRSSGRVKSSRHLATEDEEGTKKRSSSGKTSSRRVARNPSGAAPEDGAKPRSSTGSRMAGARSRSSRNMSSGDLGEPRRAASSRKLGDVKRSASSTRKISSSRGTSVDGEAKRSSGSRKGMEGRQRSSRNMEGRPSKSRSATRKLRDEDGEERPRKSKSDATKCRPKNSPVADNNAQVIPW